MQCWLARPCPTLSFHTRPPAGSSLPIVREDLVSQRRPCRRRRGNRLSLYCSAGRRSYAVEKVDFGNLYPPGAIEAVDLAELRARLEALPCCTVDKSGTKTGDPLNLVVVGTGADAIFPFIARGWRLDEPLDIHSMLRSVRAFLFGADYLTAPLSPLYLFGRTQDVSLQKARHKISLRNHLRLWQAPFTIDGQHVWVGQISRDIGIKLTTRVLVPDDPSHQPRGRSGSLLSAQDLVMTNEVSQFSCLCAVPTRSIRGGI